ncbi:MAG: hypothetical protein HFG71_07730 [Hungatella sp.]|jgi:hypothetical protein|nr:hypothetical protein [Hungatella sp.]
MVYETFQTKIANTLQSHLGADYQLIFQKVPKNNGILLDGLCIIQKDRKASPTIYLNNYYDRYQEGIPFHSIIKEILQIYQDNSSVTNLDFSILNDFSRLKEKVVYKLIHTASNKRLLADMPSVPFLDLSIVFYLFLEKNESGQMTALIHNDHMKAWDTSKDELYRLAVTNTPALLPARLSTMAEVLKTIAREHLGSDYREEFLDSLLSPCAFSPLYVLSNSSGISGAGAVLYPHLLKNFAETMKSDLVILPSSVHEVLLIPNDEHVSFDDLADTVSHINRAEVPVEDRLSDQIYLYSRERDAVIFAGPPVSSILS